MTITLTTEEIQDYTDAVKARARQYALELYEITASAKLDVFQVKPTQEALYKKVDDLEIKKPWPCLLPKI